MSQSPTLAVEAHDVVKVFPKGNERALDGVSLNVTAGTVLGLARPQRRRLQDNHGAHPAPPSRILSPDSGSAAIFGHDVTKDADTVRRLIGLAGQYATVDENLTGRENLRMVGRLTHLGGAVANARADELLKQFGLSEAGNRGLKTYSGGMRRRLDLAAALVARPPILFLDEPTTGLDPQSRQDMWVITEELVASGVTVLLTTQYLEEADRLADQVVVIDHGRIIAEGSPADLKADLGTTVISVNLANPATIDQAKGLLVGLSDKPPVLDGSTIELTVEEGPRVAADVRCAPSTSTASPWPA